jgi:hypothetical protein
MTPPSSEPAEEETLPPYLRDCPTELDQLPLQVHLLTMELAATRLLLARLARHLQAPELAPAPLPDFLGAADG